jgi:hypothetical protein
MRNLILGAIIAIGLIGCGGSNAPKPQKTTKTKQYEKNKKHIAKGGMPAWVYNPDLDGNTGVVSIINKKKVKNKKKRLYIAKLKAQAKFQARKGTNVKSNTTASKRMSAKGGYKRDIKKEIKLSSSHIQTNELVVKDTYEDKDNFYLWMVIKK